MKNKNIYIIAGPNGAGKTTFAVKFLPDYVKCPNFVNADLIAQGLAPFSPNTAAIKAGKLVLNQIDNFAAQGVDFAFETTLSGKTYLRLFKALKAKGYKLHLFFLWIPDKRLALARIKDRVQAGGHNIPPNDARRRFVRSIYNFSVVYRFVFDFWMLFDNSGTTPRLIAREKDCELYIADKKLFGIIVRIKEIIE
ncbi:MAG: zeta toxin family protein [Candidatus Omnitrophica bacterium]|nr:zeta toxin family protein [Candidatus Omnitrophota bacterium]